MKMVGIQINMIMRDYIQLIYELLPESAKGTYIKDPLELEKESGLEIGE